MFTGLSTLRKIEKKTVEQTAEAKKLQDYLQKYTSGEVEECDLDALGVFLDGKCLPSAIVRLTYVL